MCLYKVCFKCYNFINLLQLINIGFYQGAIIGPPLANVVVVVPKPLLNDSPN